MSSHVTLILESKLCGSLRRIFGSERQKMAGGWKRLHNEELHNLYSSLNIVRMIKSRRARWTGYVAHMGEMKNAYKILDGKPEGKRPIGRRSSRWEDNIRTDLRGIMWEGVDWMQLAYDRENWRALV